MKRSETGHTKAILLAAFGISLPFLAAHAMAEPGQQRDALASPAPATTQTAAAPDAGAPDSAGPAAATPTVTDANHFHDGIVAIVNDHPISEYDLDQRMALVMSTSSVQQTPEMLKKIRTQILEQLETEMIQRQEALKNDVTVSSVEVDKEIQRILTDNHMQLDQLKEVLSRGHVAMGTLRAQIAAQLLWQKAVQQEYAGRVNIAPEAVDAEMQRIAEGASKTHYVVSEIFLAVDNPDLDEKVLKDAQNLENQISAGAPFQAVARQFSQSPSAAEGGDIGLIYDGQLAPEINAALAKMNAGDISPPIRSTGGYYIIALRQRLEAVGTKITQAAPDTKIPSGSLPLARILLPLGPKPAQSLVDGAMKVGQDIRQHVSNCQILPRIVHDVRGSVYFDLGMTKLSDLSQQIRDALAKTEPGGTTEPFQSAAGIEIFVRCDKAVIKQIAFEMPTRDQVEEQLFEEQITALARRYSRDLKRNADIEAR